MVLQEYGPELVYIKGPDNVVADALSRLELLPEDPTDNSDVAVTSRDSVLNNYVNINHDKLPDDAYPLRM